MLTTSFLHHYMESSPAPSLFSLLSFAWWTQRRSIRRRLCYEATGTCALRVGLACCLAFVEFIASRVHPIASPAVEQGFTFHTHSGEGLCSCYKNEIWKAMWSWSWEWQLDQRLPIYRRSGCVTEQHHEKPRISKLYCIYSMIPKEFRSSTWVFCRSEQHI